MPLDLAGWEGPLDLLLSLARAQKVDLREISILQLVEQYPAVIEDARVLRLEIAADWLVMAAWLAFLKPGLLLPREPDADPDADELAARLRFRLARLDAMREAGARLMARDRMGAGGFSARRARRVARRPQAAVAGGPHDLLAAYGAIRARASSFAAALELARQGRVELRQAAPFAPLYIRAA